MKDYLVLVEEILRRPIVVSAESKEEAEKAAHAFWMDEAVRLEEGEDFDDAVFHALHEIGPENPDYAEYQHFDAKNAPELS